MNSSRKTAIVIGAGPAGLSAADELHRSGRMVSVLEQDPDFVGGLARTVNYQGFRFDIGAHRFFSKNPEIRKWWSERLGEDFLEVDRLTRILYRGKYFYYPLRLPNVLRRLGLIESARCMLSYCASKLSPIKPEVSFEDWVRNRFGTRLFKIFFEAYTEKVWGMPCDKISADWAAQRIRGLSLFRAVVEGLGLQRKEQSAKTLAERFHFPRLGCGMMWEKTRDDLFEGGVCFKMGQKVTRVHRSGSSISSIETIDPEGRATTHFAEDYIFSMPLGDLALAIDPPLPASVRRAAEQLKYRHLLLVLLIVDRADVFPDHWIYIHDPSVSVGRIANFRNWSLDMVPTGGKTGLALDYFCSEGDALWERSDEELLELARTELAALGLVSTDLISGGRVLRVPRAYPVFDADYKNHIAVIRATLERISNLHVAGRNGMHKYNNQDHSMLTGIMAARAANGEAVDPWRVNIDAAYLEEEEETADSSRLIPAPLDPQVRSA